MQTSYYTGYESSDDPTGFVNDDDFDNIVDEKVYSLELEPFVCDGDPGYFEGVSLHL